LGAAAGAAAGVEVGRVALIANGKYEGKLVVIADLVDQKRILCENPIHAIPRQVFKTQDINLTDLKINVPHGARGGVIKKHYLKDEIDSKWEKTAWAQKLAGRVAKRQLSDFGRFKSAKAKMVLSRKVKKVLKTMK